MLQSCQVPRELVRPGRAVQQPTAAELLPGSAVLALHPLSGLFVRAKVAAGAGADGRPTVAFLEVCAAAVSAICCSRLLPQAVATLSRRAWSTRGLELLL